MKSKKLDKITIKGFKSIHSLEYFSLGSINLLIGSNGSGKSNFIEIFRLLSLMTKKELQQYIKEEGGSENILHFGQKTTSEIYICLYFGDNRYDVTLAPAATDRLYLKEESTSFRGAPEYELPYTEIYKPSDESQVLVDAKSGVAEFTSDFLKQVTVYHFQDTSISSKLRKACEIRNNRFLQPDASNLPAFLYFLKRKYNFHYNKIVETIRLAAPFFDDFILEPDALNNDYIHLEWKHLNSKHYFNSHSISDGTLRFICLATVLLQPQRPSVILLDEPEIGLHPSAIYLLSELIKSASVDSQIISTTQSVTMVNQFEPEDIIVIDRINERSVFNRLNKKGLEHWLFDYSLGELWEKNLLGGRP